MVLQSVGLPVEGVALVAGVDRILDMMRTTVNVTGDAAVATCVDAMQKRATAAAPARPRSWQRRRRTFVPGWYRSPHSNVP